MRPTGSTFWVLLNLQKTFSSLLLCTASYPFFPSCLSSVFVLLKHETLLQYCCWIYPISQLFCSFYRRPQHILHYSQLYILHYSQLYILHYSQLYIILQSLYWFYNWLFLHGVPPMFVSCTLHTHTGVHHEDHCYLVHKIWKHIFQVFDQNQPSFKENSKLETQVGTMCLANGQRQNTTFNHEISAMLETKSRTISQMTSRLLVWQEQVTRPKTLQDLWRWWQG